MRRFVIGDIHGAYKALEQVFERAEFDFENDLLICLGDVADGWPEVKECFDFLLEVENLEYIMGNHDYWFFQWATVPTMNILDFRAWVNQGGRATLESYGFSPIEEGEIPESHIALLSEAHYYYELDDMCFVHGGFPPDTHPSLLGPFDLMWDRDLAHSISQELNTDYERIYIGHTQHKTPGPLVGPNVTNMDSSAGWDGWLTLLDIDTKDYWISDNVLELYPNIKGRA